MKPDFTVENHGSIFLLQPLTAAAWQWIEDNININAETQFWDSAIVVEHRFIHDIVCGIQSDSLAVE